MKGVTILGATGSIGVSTLDVLARHPDRYRVVALTARSDVERLLQQCLAHHPRYAVMVEETAASELRTKLKQHGEKTEVLAGARALEEVAALAECDYVMAAIVGAAGLAPTLEAVRRGAIVAFANKEVLVCAGALVMEEARQHGARLLPVDSEHNAIFQVFEFEQPKAIERIVLTASGGPFRERPREAMRDVTPEQAVAHPNWRMGSKISVDSATMMNKGLEVIEAHHLFGLTSRQIEVVVHPQSVVHGLVYYSDGSVLAQLGSPDMRTPIANALGWPRRIPAPSPRLDLAKLARLTFEAPDPVRFPALRLARSAMQAGGGAPCVLNAANEVAVAAFLDRRVAFLEIADIVERTLDLLPDRSIGGLDDVTALDREARAAAAGFVASRARPNAVRAAAV